MQTISEAINSFVRLIFPLNCVVCGESLIANEEVFCMGCLHNIPLTNFHQLKNNHVSQIFWGRVEIENAMAFMRYSKGSRWAKLLYDLKYNGKQEVGEVMGKLIAKQLKDSELYSNIDAIVPLPLHKRRERNRGYNQSTSIAQGVAQIMKVPIIHPVERTVYSNTQTKKTRVDRWLNVENIFMLKDASAISRKHLLLVDDVVTTGATLESCAAQLLKAEGTKVSIATIGYAV